MNTLAMRTPSPFKHLFPAAFSAVLVLFARCALIAADTAPPEINVILWFDTEDYLLPADDDATKRLCELLTERDIRATFKVVGEKARVLERRGRRASAARHRAAPVTNGSAGLGQTGWPPPVWCFAHAT